MRTFDLMFQTERNRTRRSYIEPRWTTRPQQRHNLMDYPDGSVRTKIVEMLSQIGVGMGIRSAENPDGITAGCLLHALERFKAPFPQRIHQGFVLREAKIRGQELQLDCSIRCHGCKHQEPAGFSIPLAYLPVLCPPSVALRRYRPRAN